MVAGDFFVAKNMFSLQILYVPLVQIVAKIL